MMMKLYFQVKNSQARDVRDFYKFSKEPLPDCIKGLPLCMGGSVYIDKRDIDSFNRLFKSYMADARKIIDTRWHNSKMWCRSEHLDSLAESIVDEFRESYLSI